MCVLLLALGAPACGGRGPIGAIPVKVVSLGAEGITDLAVDGEDLFFTATEDGKGAARRASLDGSNAKTLATFDANATSRLVVGGESLFSSGANLVVQTPRAGGVAVVFGGYQEATSNPHDPIDLAATATGLSVATRSYMATDTDPGRVDVYDISGTFNRSMLTEVRATALDDDYVYWTTKSTVMRVRRTPGDPIDAPETIAEGQGSPSAIAVSKTHVYWLNLVSAQVMAAAKGGGAPVVLATTDAKCAFAIIDSIAVDDSGVYWSAFWAPEEDRKPDICFGRSSILRVPLEGGEITPLSARFETGTPVRLVAGATDVYYVSVEEKAILRVAK